VKQFDSRHLGLAPAAHRNIARFVMLGATDAEIADVIGITTEEVDVIRTQPAFVESLAGLKRCKAIEEFDRHAAIKKSVKAKGEVLLEAERVLMTGKKSKVTIKDGLKAAEWFLDHDPWRRFPKRSETK